MPSNIFSFPFFLSLHLISSLYTFFFSSYFLDISFVFTLLKGKSSFVYQFVDNFKQLAAPENGIRIEKKAKETFAATKYASVYVCIAKQFSENAVNITIVSFGHILKLLELLLLPNLESHNCRFSFRLLRHSLSLSLTLPCLSSYNIENVFGKYFEYLSLLIQMVLLLLLLLLPHANQHEDVVSEKHIAYV